MRRLFALIAVLVLVTAACKIETNFGAIINADGSGTIILEIGMDDEAAEFFLEGDDPFEDNEFADQPGSRTSQERRGDVTYYSVEVDVDDVSEMQDSLVDADNGVLNDLTITVTNDRVTVSGSASAEDSVGTGTDGLDLDVPLDEIFSATVYFTMPGGIVSHNADRQDGNTLFWDVPVLGGTLDIQAESDPSGTPASGGSDGFPTWAYGLLAVLVLGALWYFMNGRSSGSTGTTTTTSSDDTPPAPPPAE